MEGPGTPINYYSKDRQSDFGLFFNFNAQIYKQWKLKLGFRSDKWNMRFFYVGNISSFMYNLKRFYPPNYIFPNEYERKIRLGRLGLMDCFGYDIDGNQLDSGKNRPRQPMFLSFFVQNELNFHKLILNLGFRYERINSKALQPSNMTNPVIDPNLYCLDENHLIESDPNNFLLPRLSFLLPINNKM